MRDDKDSPEESPGRSWNYRVMEFTAEGDSWRAIHEVHYTNGVPTAYTANPAVVFWDQDGTNDQGPWVLDRMREALGKPVLTEKDFGKGASDISATTSSREPQ